MTGDDAVHRASLVLRLRSLGITGHRLVSAFESTPREYFIPAPYRDDAYADRLVPLACGQVMEAPTVLAQLLNQMPVSDEMSVLEIGSGSGYFTALLARLARRVVALERYRTLVAEARSSLAALDINNAEIALADGFQGWPAAGPYHAIFVSGAVTELPVTWLEQIAPGGALVAPVGSNLSDQTWSRFSKNADGMVTESVLARAFSTPLTPGVARVL